MASSMSVDTEGRAMSGELGGPQHVLTHPQEVIIHEEKPLKAPCMV